jgi:glycosyltransferase involved in cell wall biosynthesis
MVGMPVVGLATTEMVTVIQNGFSGVLHTDVDYLTSQMELLLNDRTLAARLGSEGKKVALGRFNIERFTKNWQRFLADVIAEKSLSVV